VDADHDDYTVLHIGPGARSLCPAPMARGEGHSDDPAHRWRVAAGTWKLVERVWQDTHALTFLYPNKFYALRMFWSARDGSFMAWYVNYQRPYTINDHGFVSLDLELDVFYLPPDLKPMIKDKPQFDAGVAAGAITLADVAGIKAARAEIDNLFELKQEPFLGDWTDWRPSADLPALVLPEGLLRQYFNR
jgi:hypothetical protein